jgi:hypothetical protein
MPHDFNGRFGFSEMIWSAGRLAWAIAIVLLAISLYEFSEPDLGSGLGLFIIFLVLLVVLRRFKVKW